MYLHQKLVGITWIVDINVKGNKLPKMAFSSVKSCKTKVHLRSLIYISSLKLNIIMPVRYFSFKHDGDLSKCFAVLQVSENCDQEQVREAFIKLVKRFHPDSGSPEADSEKFNQIESAYRRVQNHFATVRWKVNEGIGEYGLYYTEKNQSSDAQEFDIQHTAPQHRQYLSYGGYGSGTPMQREKQYQKYKAHTAAVNVHNHRANKLSQNMEANSLVKNTREAKKIKIRSELERLVEDLIQESMAKGDFDNLKGKGKPLPHRVTNPYVDFVTHKMNEVLIDNGFTPEWITLQKEIKNELQILRDSLAQERTWFGHHPLTQEEKQEWEIILEKHKILVTRLNSKINKYNLLVPILTKQKLFVSLISESKTILETGKTKHDFPNRKIPQKQTISTDEDSSSFLGIISSLFSK